MERKDIFNNVLFNLSTDIEADMYSDVHFALWIMQCSQILL